MSTALNASKSDRNVAIGDAPHQPIVREQAFGGNMEADEKKCPSCAETIKWDATACRFCGYSFIGGSRGAAPRSGPGAGKIIGFGCLGLIGLIVLMAVIGSFLPDAPKSPVTNESSAAMTAEPEDQPLAVSSRELAAAYDANEMAAQKQFGDRKLAVTGRIVAIDLDFADDPVVRLEGVNMFQNVSASFDKSYSDKTAALRKGQTVTVVCTKLIEVVGSPMLNDCSM